MPSDSLTTTRRPPISEEHMRKLTDVRRDIVHTIRQVVDVVSKYAGGALPEPARNRVRGFILKLPQRWASRAGPATAGSAVLGSERDTVAAAAGHGTGAVRRPGGTRRAAHRERGTGAPEPGMRSGQSSRAPSPSSSPRLARASLGSTHARHGDTYEHAHGEVVSASAALVASQRILTLATESLDMMRNVTGVVKDSLDRADAYVYSRLQSFCPSTYCYYFTAGSAAYVRWASSEAYRAEAAANSNSPSQSIPWRICATSARTAHNPLRTTMPMLGAQVAIPPRSS